MVVTRKGGAVDFGDGTVAQATVEVSGVDGSIGGGPPLPAGGTLGTPFATSLTTTATSALASNTCKVALVQSDPANLVNILVGNVTAQVFILEPGDVVSIPVSNTSQISAKNASSATQNLICAFVS